LRDVAWNVLDSLAAEQSQPQQLFNRWVIWWANLGLVGLLGHFEVLWPVKWRTSWVVRNLDIFSWSSWPQNFTKLHAERYKSYQLAARYGCKKFKKTRRRAHASSKAACPTQAPNTPWGYIALRPTAGVRYPGNSVGQMQPQKPWSRFKRERKIRGVKEWCRNKSHAQERRELSGLQPWGGRPAWRCTRSALARHSSEDSPGVTITIPYLRQLTKA
jgi:hypothetical protein